MDYERLDRAIRNARAMYNFFSYRDRMNAQVHLDSVRDSEITIASLSVLEYLEGLYSSARIVRTSEGVQSDVQH